MNLLVDCGNSFVKWAQDSDEELILKNQCHSSSAASLPELWKNYDTPARVLVANVAGDRVENKIKKAVNLLWNINVEFVKSSKCCCNLTSSYHIPGQLGVDRWMAMLSAFKTTPGSVIVVDCGTAVTIDLVNDEGVFIGGAIMPGLNMAFQSLRAGTDAVEHINSANNDTRPVAQSTEDGVATGVLYGLCGGIEKVVREQALLVGDTPTVFLTGGDAEALLPYLTMPVVLQSDLVLQGLQIVASNN